MAAEAWRSELSVAVAAVGEVGIAAAVEAAEEEEEEDDDFEGCGGIVETVVTAVVDVAADAVAMSSSAAASPEWKQCAGGGETWQSEKPSDLQRAC